MPALLLNMTGLVEFFNVNQRAGVAMPRLMTYDLRYTHVSRRTDSEMKRNHIAKDLRKPKYRQRTLKNRRRYTRKVKHLALQTEQQIQDKV